MSGPGISAQRRFQNGTRPARLVNGSRRGRRALFSIDIWLFYFLAVGTSLAYIFSGRDLSRTSDLLMSSEFQSVSAIGQAINALSLLACLIAVYQIVLRGVVSRGAVVIAAGTGFYYGVCFLAPSAFDPWFVFDLNLLYPAAALSLIIAPTVVPTRVLALNFARAATIPAAMSLVILVLNNKAAVLESYQSILPFFPGRLYGVTAHANVLGSICAFAIMLLAAFPPNSRLERNALLAFNLVALVLSQSKTAWLTVLLGLPIIYLPSFRRFGNREPFAAAAALALAIALPVALTIVSILDNSIYGFWVENENVEEISTLTGRTEIWNVTLYLISQHPLTGPGWATFLIFMESMYPNLVPNPHNLLLATMVQAGFAGVFSLVAFLLILIVVALRLSRGERLFALAYIVLIITRGLTESFTFQIGFTAPTFWTLLMFLRLLALMTREGSHARAPLQQLPRHPRAAVLGPSP